jgi:Domain of unknown function (DUF4258)
VKGSPLTKDRAKAQLVLCMEDGVVVNTRHFLEELANDDLTMEDVLAVCRSGAVIMEPEKDIRNGQWKYRVEGPTADLRRVAIVFTFKSELAVFITVFEVN